MAVGTAATALTATWVSLGNAPMIVQVQGNPSPALIAAASTQPSAGAAGISIEPGDAPLSISGVGQIWARAVRTSSRIVAAVLA